MKKKTKRKYDGLFFETMYDLLDLFGKTNNKWHILLVGKWIFWKFKVKLFFKDIVYKWKKRKKR